MCAHGRASTGHSIPAWDWEQLHTSIPLALPPAASCPQLRAPGGVRRDPVGVVVRCLWSNRPGLMAAPRWLHSEGFAGACGAGEVVRWLSPASPPVPRSLPLAAGAGIRSRLWNVLGWFGGGGVVAFWAPRVQDEAGVRGAAARTALASPTCPERGSRLLLSLFTHILAVPIPRPRVPLRSHPRGQAGCWGPTARTHTPGPCSPGEGLSSGPPPCRGMLGARVVPQSSSPRPSAPCTKTNFLAFILLEDLKTRLHPQGPESKSKSGDRNLLVSLGSDYFKANFTVSACQVRGAAGSGDPGPGQGGLQITASSAVPIIPQRGCWIFFLCKHRIFIFSPSFFFFLFL